MLNNRSEVSDFTRDVLRRISELGHITVLSSGRSIHSIMETAKKLGILFPGMYICAANGAMIYECDTDKLLHTTPVPLKYVEPIWTMASEINLHIQTYTDDKLVVPSKDKETDFYMIRCPHTLLLSKHPWEILKSDPVKLLAIDLDDHEKLENFGREVSLRFPMLDAMFSNEWYLEIISKEAGKGNALRWLCNYLNIPISCSYGAGDQSNDVSMIRAAGTGIAMSNGDPNIFKYADVLSEFDNDHDGLSQYIVKEFI